MRALRGLLILILLLVIVLAGLFAFSWRGEIAADANAARQSFAKEDISKGARLAALGNCIACHTVSGRQAFAGGLPLPTPFGTIYSTNVTPDPETGIGSWSEEAFRRAMREGVDREGNHLYPAFPYDHYTLVTDADIHAIYAYLMTRTPVKQEAMQNTLRFPFGFRPLLAGWKLLFLHEGPYVPDQQRDDAMNRGAYLVEGLGHCGACHTPRNRFGAEDKDRKFAGGEAEGWVAYPINAGNPAPKPWDAKSLAFYLRHGWHQDHGVARGPMTEVTGNLSAVPDSDIDAIAAYFMSYMGERGQPAAVESKADETSAGAVIYRAACASCHESGRPLPFGGLDLKLSTAVNADNPQNIVNVVLFGLPPADGEQSAIMPAFASSLTDQNVTDLLGYMRARFSGKPMWQGLSDQIRRTRSGDYPVAVRPADGIERGPANIGAAGTEVSP